MENDLIRIHPRDNVAVAVDGAPGIPAGHKAALRDIAAGEAVVKYGWPIGVAKESIPAGAHVHSHNLRSALTRREDYEYKPDFEELPPLAPAAFMGYRRPDGRAGIRNEVWIIPTVGCVNGVAKAIEKAAAGYKTERIDAIQAYSHPYGCSQLGDDQLHTQQLLCGLINHPNAAGVLVLSLGCENNNLAELQKVLGPVDEARVKFLVCQDCGDEVAAGTALVKELCGYADTFVRTPCPASGLVLGLKCGGSDGLSGITANPLVGRVSDKLIAMGGAAILTEVPEMFGAEELLMARCRTPELFGKTVALINDFKDYFARYGQPIDENPSPGNKAGGITTLAEKALGCTQKGGTAPVEAVLAYGEAVGTAGLSLLQAPGNDLVAACALAASGAQLVLFTTGRGTPFGCPAPTMKISTNAALAAHKAGWIDFDASAVLTEGFDGPADALFEAILAVASGRRVKSEALDKTDLAIFKDGVTL